MCDRDEFEKWIDARPIVEMGMGARAAMFLAYKAGWEARQAPASGEVEPAGFLSDMGLKALTADEDSCQCATIVPIPNEYYRNPLYTHPPAKVPEGLANAIKAIADKMEKVEGESAEGGYMWGARECAEFIREEAERLTTPTPATTPETDWVKPTGRHHELKTDYSVFQQSAAGLKPWEIRKNDRGFSVGDTVTLRETEYTGEEMADGAPLAFTGRTVSGVIGYVLDGPVYGLSDKWCIFTLQSTPPQEQ